jgi:hypothetical protein
MATVADLRKVARRLRIPRYYRLVKADLLDAIETSCMAIRLQRFYRKCVEKTRRRRRELMVEQDREYQAAVLLDNHVQTKRQFARSVRWLQTLSGLSRALCRILFRNCCDRTLCSKMMVTLKLRYGEVSSVSRETTQESRKNDRSLSAPRLFTHAVVLVGPRSAAGGDVVCP